MSATRFSPPVLDLAVRETALFEVALVVVLSAPEVLRGRDLGHDRAAVAPALLKSLLRLLRRLLLLRAVDEDDRTVLCPDVGPLLVERGGIVVLPEDVEKPIVRDARRIELHLDAFGVSGPAGADVLVRRVREGAARIADRRVDHARYLAERRLDPPETTRRERRLFGHGFEPPVVISVSSTPTALREFRNLAKVFHHVRLAVEIPAAKDGESDRLGERPPENGRRNVAGKTGDESSGRDRGPEEQHGVP